MSAYQKIFAFPAKLFCVGVVIRLAPWRSSDKKTDKCRVWLQDISQLLEGCSNCLSFGARIVRPTYNDAEGVR